MSFPSATSEPRICQVQFEEAQLSHRSAEPEKIEDQGEDRTEDEANLGKWNPSQFAPYMTGNFQSNHVQPCPTRFSVYFSKILLYGTYDQSSGTSSRI